MTHLGNLVGDYAHLFGNIDPLLITLDKEYKSKEIYPSKKDVFKAFRHCPYSELKVVVVGMDPYSQRGYATGIAFANPIGTNPVSPSLELLRERIRKDFYLENPADFNFDITLESWAKQGILLINSALTVVAGHTGSHGRLWYPVLKNFFTNLSSYNTGIVYLLLGTQAQQFLPFIDSKNNYVLCYKHPAYYARINMEFKCDGFIKAQEIVKRNNNYLLKF